MYLWFLKKIWIWKPRVIDYYIGCKRFPIEYNCCHGWCYDNSFDRRNFSAWPKNINCSLQCRVNKFCLKRRKKKSRKKKKISRKLLGCFESLIKWKYTQSRNAGPFNAGCYNRESEIIMQMWCSQEKKAARWINTCVGKYDYFQKHTKSSM